MPVNIRLSEKFSLIEDINCWIITENTRPKWFYTTLYDALRDWYFNEAPKGSRARNELQLLHFLKNAEMRLIQALNNITKRDVDTKTPLIKQEEKKNEHRSS
jgi:hypothetical protein